MLNWFANQGERDGFYELGCNCKELSSEALVNFRFAAKLGHIAAMFRLGSCLKAHDEDDPMIFYWWGAAARMGDGYMFLNAFPSYIDRFRSGQGRASSMFEIAIALMGCINRVEKTIFSVAYKFEKRIVYADAAIFWLKGVLNTWSMIGRRNGVVKDVRLIIAKLIVSSPTLKEV